MFIEEIKLTDSDQSSKINKDLITVMLSIVILGSTAIACATYYNMNDRNNMAKNIESAIQKGIDPLSVKCSYDTTPDATCIAYAFSQNTIAPGGSQSSQIRR
jgi:hypothetical protein